MFLFLFGISVWILFAVVAILGGYFRSKVLNDKFGKKIGHILNIVIICLAILLISFICFQLLTVEYLLGDLIIIGVLWVLMSVLLESFFNHFLLIQSGEGLLTDYNIFKGRLWIFVLLTELLTPLLWGYVI